MTVLFFSPWFCKFAFFISEELNEILADSIFFQPLSGGSSASSIGATDPDSSNGISEIIVESTEEKVQGAFSE